MEKSDILANPMVNTVLPSVTDWLMLVLACSSALLTVYIIIRQIRISKQQNKVLKEQNSIALYQLRYELLNRYIYTQKKVNELSNEMSQEEFISDCFASNNPIMYLYLKNIMPSFTDNEGVSQLQSSIELSHETGDNSHLKEVLINEIGKFSDCLRKIKYLFALTNKEVELLDRTLKIYDVICNYVDGRDTKVRTFDYLVKLYKELSRNLSDKDLLMSLNKVVKISN